MPSSVGIIDYGAGNILNVARAFEKNHVKTEIVTEPGSLKAHSHIVLPGVGSFDYGMENLHQRNLVGALIKNAHEGVPILGICLGMQLLAKRGHENGETDGLGLIRGDIVHLATSPGAEARHKIPHTGWSPLFWNHGESSPSGSLLGAAYFNHSYFLSNFAVEDVVATTWLGSLEIPAVVRSGSILATQFHPEKSGEMGLRFLCEWIESA